MLREVYVIVPAYNEAKRIGELLSRLEEVGIKNVIVMDDGSRDSTREVVKNFRSKSLRITLLHNKRNRGKGYSVRKALKFLRKEVRPDPYDIVVIMDGDLQHKPRDLPKFFIALEDADIVIGNRDKSSYPLIKKFGNWFLTQVVRMLTGYDIHDGECGYKAFRWYVAEEVLPHLRYDRYAFEGEFLIIASKLGFRATEVNVESSYIKGKGVKVMDGIKNFLAYLNTWLYAPRED